MNKTKLAVMIISALMTTTGLAFDLTSLRHDIANRYIADLGNANTQDIVSLFEENGTVVSTSKGRMNAKAFFQAFLPEIDVASTKINQSFSSVNDPNRIAVRFHFTYKLKDGDAGEGEYVDEFVFTNNSIKLAEVIMFENLKFKQG